MAATKLIALYVNKSKAVSANMHERLAKEATAQMDHLLSNIKQKEIRMHIINYSKTRVICTAYRKAGYSRNFFEANREEITLHKAAKDAFSTLSDEKIPKVKELNAEYADVLVKKKVAYAEYRQAKKEMQDYVTAKHNIDAFLRAQENEQDRKKQREAR